jgi:hypothetical protein
MFRKLERLIGLAGPVVAPEPLEAFGESRIARERGLEILRATAERRSHLQGIRDRLSSMTREEKDELVDRVIARVALFVFDLPASKANHHARRFGLLDHLLEVAHLAARELSSPGFQISPEPSINRRERPLWIYAGMVVGLAHDIAKPLDLDVLLPGTPAAWDPWAEPLRLFCERNHLEETGPAVWNFRPGRGLHGHERRVPELFPLVFPPSVGAYLGPRLASVIHAFSSGKDFRRSPDLSWAACEVVRVVWQMDQASAGTDGEGDTLPREMATEESPRKEAPGPIYRTALAVDRPASREGALQDLGAPRLDFDVPEAGEAPDLEPEALPFPVPADYWAERVPGPRGRRGDPEENRRRLAAELEPARFLQTLRRMIVTCRLSRNNLYTEAYLRPDYVWLLVPRALRRIAVINHLPFDTEVLDLMIRSLAASGQVEPWSPRQVPVYIKTRLDSATFRAIRIKTPGFLSESDLARLGLYALEIRIIDPLDSTPSRRRGS